MDLLLPSEGLFFWQSLTFLIVLFILAKFVWKPIMKGIKDRESSIEDALSAAENAKAEMANLTATNEKLISEAKAERDAMIKDAQATAKGIVNEAKGAAQTEATALIEKAQASIAAEKRAAVAEIRNQAATLSVEIAEMLLRAELKDKKTQEDILAKYAGEADLTTA